MIKRFIFWQTLVLIILLFTGFAAAEVKTFTHTVKQPFGGSQSPDDARVAAMVKAKREVLEKAGTYLESFTIVKENVIEKDEVLALAAGVLKVEIVSQKNYHTEDAFGIIVKAKVNVDTSILEERIKSLLKDRELLRKYQDSQKREKDLLAKIKSLEEQNRKTKDLLSNVERERLKEEFRKASQELAANGLNEKALSLLKYGFYTDVAKAMEYLNQAIRLDPNYGDAYNNIGGAYDNKGDYDRALEYYQKSLKIGLKKLGPEHPGVAIDYNNTGVAYDSKGEYDRAIEYYQKALKIDLKKLGPEHPGVAIDYNNIGMAYNSEGEYGRAIEYLKKALKITRKRLGKDHPYTKTIQRNLESVR